MISFLAAWFLVITVIVGGASRTYSVPVTDEAECHRLGQVQLLSKTATDYRCEDRSGVPG